MFGVQKKSIGDLDYWFDDVFGRGGIYDNALFKCISPDDRVARADIIDGGNQILISIDAPGYESANIDISASEGILTVSGKRSTTANSNGSKIIRQERHEEAFSRSFKLGDAFDANLIAASLKNGVLTVTIPKVTPKDSSVKIAVKSE